MKLFRAKHPYVLRYLAEKMSEENLDKRINQYILRFAQNPESLCIEVVFEEEILKAFVIAYVEPDEPYAWIDEGWAEASLAREYKIELMDRVEDWALSQSRKELRAETTRPISAWERLYDFKEYAVIIRKDLSDE